MSNLPLPPRWPHTFVHAGAFSTLATRTPSRCGEVSSVRLVKRMAPDAMRLRRVSRRHSRTPKDIRPLIDWLKVFWIDARGTTTQMVERQTSRDWASVPLIHQPVGEHLPRAVPRGTVTHAILTALPDPAARLGINRVFRPHRPALMAIDVPARRTANQPTVTLTLSYQRGLLSASALTQTGRDGILTKHRATPRCHPRPFAAARGLFAASILPLLRKWRFRKNV